MTLESARQIDSKIQSAIQIIDSTSDMYEGFDVVKKSELLRASAKALSEMFFISNELYRMYPELTSETWRSLNNRDEIEAIRSMSDK